MAESRGVAGACRGTARAPAGRSGRCPATGPSVGTRPAALGRGWAAPGSLIVATVCLCASPVAAQESVTAIAVQEDVGDWVLDEASGRVFASSVGKDVVLEFDAATGKEVRRITVGG